MSPKNVWGGKNAFSSRMRTARSSSRLCGRGWFGNQAIAHTDSVTWPYGASGQCYWKPWINKDSCPILYNHRADHTRWQINRRLPSTSRLITCGSKQFGHNRRPAPHQRCRPPLRISCMPQDDKACQEVSKPPWPGMLGYHKSKQGYWQIVLISRKHLLAVKKTSISSSR